MAATIQGHALTLKMTLEPECITCAWRERAPSEGLVDPTDPALAALRQAIVITLPPVPLAVYLGNQAAFAGQRIDQGVRIAATGTVFLDVNDRDAALALHTNLAAISRTARCNRTMHMARAGGPDGNAQFAVVAPSHHLWAVFGKGLQTHHYRDGDRFGLHFQVRRLPLLAILSGTDMLDVMAVNDAP